MAMSAYDRAAMCVGRVSFKITTPNGPVLLWKLSTTEGGTIKWRLN